MGIHKIKGILKKKWTPKSKKFCCINCGANHTFMIRNKNNKGLNVYTLNFCSTGCGNEYMKNHKVIMKDFRYKKNHIGYWRAQWLKYYFENNK